MKKKPVTLQGHYAGFVTRLFAFIMDIFIIMAVTGIASIAFGLVLNFFNLTPDNVNASSGSGNLASLNYATILVFILLIFNTIIFFGYFIFFWMTSGQTLGKGFMGVRVISMDGRPLSFVQAVVRLIGYWISAVVFFLGFIWITIDDQRQGWHDTMARTYVIYSWKATLHPQFLRRWRK